jgi:hypothetical protein
MDIYNDNRKSFPSTPVDIIDISEKKVSPEDNETDSNQSNSAEKVSLPNKLNQMDINIEIKDTNCQIEEKIVVEKVNSMLKLKRNENMNPVYFDEQSDNSIIKSDEMISGKQTSAENNKTDNYLYDYQQSHHILSNPKTILYDSEGEFEPRLISFKDIELDSPFEEKNFQKNEKDTDDDNPNTEMKTNQKDTDADNVNIELTTNEDTTLKPPSHNQENDHKGQKESTSGETMQSSTSEKTIKGTRKKSSSNYFNSFKIKKKGKCIEREIILNF